MSELTSRQRVLATIKWKPVDRFPVMVSGRFPQLIGHTFHQDRYNPEAQAELAYKQWEEFGQPDIVSVFGGGSLEALIKPDLHYPDDDYPQYKSPVIKSQADVDALKVPTEAELLKNDQIRSGLEAVRILRKRLGPDVIIAGGAGGVYNPAALLTGTDNLLKFLKREPKLVWDLTSKIVGTALVHQKLQVEAGVDLLGSGDATSSPACISPKQFVEHALPHFQRLFENAKKLGAITRYHPCGGEYPIIDQLHKTGADIFHFTELVDLAVAQKIFVGRYAVAGGVDVVTGPLFLGTPDEVDLSIKTLIEGLRFKTGTIIQPACGLSPNIPIANIKAYVAAVKKYSKGALSS